jgi:S1-C subfamily serine protease
LAPAAAPARARRRWLAPLIAALVGGLIGGGIVAYADDGDGGTSVRVFGTNSSKLAKPKDIQGVLAKVEPAVVSVRTDAFQRGTFFDLERVRGAGTGMILTADGEVLTNNHVVEGASSITVTLTGEKEARPADLVRRDAAADVAIVKIRDAKSLPTVRLGDSDKLLVGDDVLAIGNALDLSGGPSVTAGIVSAVHRTLEGDQINQRFSDLIQTDAAINAGNSGGPLVNSDGQVVGMNTVVIQSTGGQAVQNIGFAIAINAVKTIVAGLEKGGATQARGSAFLGASLRTVTPALKERLNLEVDNGALVQDVVAGSPAENAGLQTGDVITKFDGKDVKTSIEIVTAIGTHKPGDKVDVEYKRGGANRQATVTLGSRPAGAA